MPKFSSVQFFKICAQTVNSNWVSGRAEGEPWTEITELQGSGSNMVRTLQNRQLFLRRRKWWERFVRGLCKAGKFMGGLHQWEKSYLQHHFQWRNTLQSGWAHRNTFCEKLFSKCFWLFWSTSNLLGLLLPSQFKHAQTYLLIPEPWTEPTLKSKNWTGPKLNLRFCSSVQGSNWGSGLNFDIPGLWRSIAPLEIVDFQMLMVA
jgi:hypothetical protein